MKKLLLLSALIMSMVALKAESGDYNLQFCGDVYQWTYAISLNKTTYRCYIHIPKEIANEMAGNKITDIMFSTASDFTSSPRNGSVFVTETLEGLPITSTRCEIIDCYRQGKNGGGWTQTVALEESYTIKENTEFYFGYTVENVRYSKNTQKYDYPIGIDNMPANDFAGFIDVTTSDGEFLGTLDFGASTGTNLFLSAKTTGEFAGFEDLCSLGNATYGAEFALPVKDINDEAPIYFPIQNIGSKAITSLEYGISINGNETEVNTLDVNIEPKTEEYIKIPAPKYVEGKNKVCIKIYKVNDKELSGISSNVSCIVLGDASYDRKFVVEEGTGTWCGYCPRGIVGLEYMSQKYQDMFIGIAIHYNDAMAVDSYSPIYSIFSGGYPNCIVNRDPYHIGDPNKNNLEEMYETWLPQRAIGKVDLTVSVNDNEFDVKAETTFAYDEEDAFYSLAFVILEDGIVASQSNYFSGNADALEWWGEQPEKVDWTFEHTARDIFNYAGLAGSIPTSITANEPISFETTLQSNNVKNIDKTSVVALLLDGSTGTILNATKVAAKDYKNSNAVELIDYNSDAPTEYYNLNGIRVKEPTKGSIIIRRQSKMSQNASKLIVF